jgi:hypothetical protein
MSDSNKVYSIVSWNQIIGPDNIIHPIFTFVPDLQFLKYIQLNTNPIAIHLSGTEWYDGVHFADCYSSKDFPNYGPNFFSVTENYVMVLKDVEFSFFPSHQNGPAIFALDLSVRSPGFERLSSIEITSTPDLINGIGPDSLSCTKESFAIPKNVGDSVSDNSNWQNIIIVFLIIIGLFILGYAIIRAFQS